MHATPHEEQAREYLVGPFGAAGFSDLVPIGEFDESPLEGEGRVSIFAFTAAPGGGLPERYHAVVGQTQPNYYPAWSLSPEEVYCLHIGTRFMLVLEIGQLPMEALPPNTEADAIAALNRVAPGEPLTEFHPAVTFQVDNQKHVVARCRIGPEDVYLVIGELPLGIYRRIDLPPHVIYRMHLGQVIRMERDEQD